jgi:hypothetical protein
MSTAVETPNTDNVTAHQSANFTSENYTLNVGYTKDELSKEESKRKLKAYPEDAFSAEELAAGEFQVVFSQTAIIYHPENLDGVQELVGDDEEKVNLFDAQLKVKQINRFRSSVVSKDYAPVDNSIDMFDACGQKSEKRLSPFEKTKNEILNKFSPEMQAKLLELLQAQMAVQ